MISIMSLPFISLLSIVLCLMLVATFGLKSLTLYLCVKKAAVFHMFQLYIEQAQQEVDGRIEGVWQRKTIKAYAEDIGQAIVTGQLSSRFRNTATSLYHICKMMFADIQSQNGRWKVDGKLLVSLADTQLLHGAVVDDKTYQMEKVIDLASTLPKGPSLEYVNQSLIQTLWDNLRHPPSSNLGKEFRYRTADGSYNNIQYPLLGIAGSHYARSVVPKTLQPAVLPDPDLIFDLVFARGSNPISHPNKISSMLFYLAAIIIHDLFRTDETDPTKVMTSSYLDLAPLYGSNQAEQDKIRTFKNGLLKPDTFSEIRLLGLPPGVAALLVCFNRFHNDAALQIREINEGGRFASAKNEDDERKLDEDLFQTARLITCGLYVNIILNDYVRTILNLNRTNSTWTLDPRGRFENAEKLHVLTYGVGNQVSCEFNLIYRWHSTISTKDEQWTENMYKQILGIDEVSNTSEDTLCVALRKWLVSQGTDPASWALDNGRYTRTRTGEFRDEDLANILSNATEDVACAFGPRQIPSVLKVVEVMGMKQARSWNVATLNEFRKFFKLQPHKTFADISSDHEVAKALEALYQHPDHVEIYPGLVAEDPKASVEPGSGLCPGFTISRTILADAVALIRGDRFYTTDYSPATLTNWGYTQISSDPKVTQGGCFHKLVMRALPNWYRGNSVYAMYPFTIPDENHKVLSKLGTEQDYNFDRPMFTPLPSSIKTWEACATVLRNQRGFRVPWGQHTFDLTGHDYMLSGDKPWHAEAKEEMRHHIYCPVNGLDEVRKFYEALTTQMIETKSTLLHGQQHQLDICKDVCNPCHTIFVAQLFAIPLNSIDSSLPLITVDQLYLAMSSLFAYVFLDADAASSFKLRANAKAAAEQLTKIVKVVCAAVEVGNDLGFGHEVLGRKSSQLLRDYGVRMIQRLLKGGKCVDEVVSNIIPTAAAAVATQAQHATQMLDLYLTEEYREHWPDIQRCALSDTNEDFEKLKLYALEANRLAPAAWGLIRRAATDVVIRDGEKTLDVKKDEEIHTDFISAGLDPEIFPSPREIRFDRPRDRYIHHGLGPHACLGRPIVEIAMAAQLKVFAKLKNLRRAPGLQGVLKKTVIRCPNPVSSDRVENPGTVAVYMTEDWSEWRPFPTTLTVHHDGWMEGLEQEVEDMMHEETGLPNRDELVKQFHRRREQTILRSKQTDETKNRRNIDTELVVNKQRQICPRNRGSDEKEAIHSLRRRHSYENIRGRYNRQDGARFASC